MDRARAWLRTTDAQLVGLTMLVKVLLFAWGLVAMALVVTAPWTWARSSRSGTDGTRRTISTWRCSVTRTTTRATCPCTASWATSTCSSCSFPSSRGATRVGLLGLPEPGGTHRGRAQSPRSRRCCFLYRLVAREFGERIGKRAAIFMLIFPTSYFLHIGYTHPSFSPWSSAPCPPGPIDGGWPASSAAWPP